MQEDGNFVTYTPQGVPYWATATDGHPGASVVLQDDGNLVVYDPANHPLWASNTAQDLRDPIIRYVGEGGYSYNETSELWKEMCSVFPCFTALQWPGYATEVIDAEINGQAVVIQLWKGWCQKFLGFLGVNIFPGGIGAEVGIYHRIPGRARIPPLPLLPSDLGIKTANAINTFTDDELWWPFPELGTTLEFSFINPRTGNTAFSAGPEKSYWLTKWMDEASYQEFQRDKPTPSSWADYILEYRINGKRYHRWPATPGDLGEAAQAGWQLLLS